jgi:hypothetical protein
VVSQQRGILRCLEEIVQYGLSTGVHMTLVTVETINTDLNIGSIRGKPVDTYPLLYSQIQQHAIEPSEAIIHDVDPSVIVQGCVTDSLEDLSGA